MDFDKFWRSIDSDYDAYRSREEEKAGKTILIIVGIIAVVIGCVVGCAVG